SDSVHSEANLHFSIDSVTRKGNTITLQGTVIQANDPANLGLPVTLLAEFHGTATAVTIELGDLAFRGSGIVNPALTIAALVERSMKRIIERDIRAWPSKSLPNNGLHLTTYSLRSYVAAASGSR